MRDNICFFALFYMSITGRQVFWTTRGLWFHGHMYLIEILTFGQKWKSLEKDIHKKRNISTFKLQKYVENRLTLKRAHEGSKSLTWSVHNFYSFSRICVFMTQNKLFFFLFPSSFQCLKKIKVITIKHEEDNTKKCCCSKGRLSAYSCLPRFLWKEMTTKYDLRDEEAVKGRKAVMNPKRRI